MNGLFYLFTVLILGILTNNIEYRKIKFSKEEFIGSMYIICGAVYPLLSDIFDIFNHNIGATKTLIVSILMGIFTIMAIEDEREMSIYNFYHLFIGIGIVFLYFSNDKPFEYMFKDSSEILFPLIFILILNGINRKKNIIGKADLWIMVETSLIFYCINKNGLIILVTWLIAYLIHGFKNIKYFSNGKLTEEKPFIPALMIANTIGLTLLSYYV